MKPGSFGDPRKGERRVSFVVWFWNFVWYSFCGFLLETAYARLTGARGSRKCLRVLPLCPVYGAGALAILALPVGVQGRPWALFLLGGLVATGVEYAWAALCQRGLGVRFWDYAGLPGNIKGRVCLPFSLAWGALAMGLVYGVEPVMGPILGGIPAIVTGWAAAAVGSDLLLSAALCGARGTGPVSAGTLIPPDHSHHLADDVGVVAVDGVIVPGFSGSSQVCPPRRERVFTVASSSNRATTISPL